MEKKSDFVSKFMTNIKKILLYKGQHLQNLPENQFDSVMKYLDAKSLLALLFANRAVKKKIIAFIALKYKTEGHDIKKMILTENYEKNLLRCAEMILLYTDMNWTVTWFTKMYVNYKTGEKFDIVYDDNMDNVNKVIKQTLQDFAEKYIKPKDETKYHDLVGKISAMHYIHFFCINDDGHEKLRLIEDIFDAGGFTELKRDVIYDDMCRGLDYITGKTAKGFCFIT